MNNSNEPKILSKHYDYNYSKLDKAIGGSFFFKGEVDGEKIYEEFFINIPLEDIGFTTEFRRCINSFNQSIRDILNLNDLLNESNLEFLMLPNCNIEIIEIAKNSIVEYINEIGFHIKKFASSQKKKSDYLFLENKKILVNSKILNFKLSEIDFCTRFNNFLHGCKEINTIEDLLNTSSTHLIKMKNCGRKTIKDTQKTLLDFIKNPENFEDKKIEMLDKDIAERIIKVINNERDTQIFLKYINYKQTQEITLEKLGEEFNLTRERIRQIKSKFLIKVNRRKLVFEQFKNYLKSYGYVINKNLFLKHLIKNNFWSKNNIRFFHKIFSEFSNWHKDLKIEKEFIITSITSDLKKTLGKINNEITQRINGLKEGYPISEILKYLKDYNGDLNLNKEKLLIKDLLMFLSKHYNTFYIVEDFIYNKMMFNVYFGTKLEDIYYWGLRFLGEPIHFTQFAEFLRNHNSKLSNTTAVKVHANLQSYEFCTIVKRGTYALKEANLPRYISCGKALLKLLKEHGPLLKNDIIRNLSSEYSEWNITETIKNNLHKLIVIGNNLYDLKP